MDQGPTGVLYRSFGAREASRLITHSLTRSIAHRPVTCRWRHGASTPAHHRQQQRQRQRQLQSKSSAATATRRPPHTSSFLRPRAPSRSLGRRRPLRGLSPSGLLMWLSRHCASRSPPSLRDMVGSCVPLEAHRASPWHCGTRTRPSRLLMLAIILSKFAARRDWLGWLST